MSSALSVIWGVINQVSGITHTAGSDTNPVRAVTLTSGAAVLNDRIIIGAGETKEVWAWANTEGFEYLALVVESDGGYLEVAHRTDPVTSDSDETPASTGKWNIASLSCFAPFELTSDRAYYCPAAADHVADSAGLPACWSDADRLRGVISKVAVQNRGTADVVLRRVVIQ